MHVESLALHMWATKHTVLNLENQKVRSCKNAGPFPLFPRHDYERSAFTIDCVGDTTKALSKFENQKVGHYKKIGLEPGVRSLKLGPHMPYKPNQGLTCLFAKTGHRSSVVLVRTPQRLLKSLGKRWTEVAGIRVPRAAMAEAMMKVLEGVDQAAIIMARRVSFVWGYRRPYSGFDGHRHGSAHHGGRGRHNNNRGGFGFTDHRRFGAPSGGRNGMGFHRSDRQGLVVGASSMYGDNAAVNVVANSPAYAVAQAVACSHKQFQSNSSRGKRLCR